MTRAKKIAAKNCFAVALLSVCATAFSQDASQALQRISVTDVFAFGGIGYAGKISDGEKDFKIIMSGPPEQAMSDLEKLYTFGNPQAKSYALAGIRKLNRGRFVELLGSVDGSKVTVKTEQGCIVMERSLKEIAMDLSAGKYDLWLP